MTGGPSGGTDRWRPTAAHARAVVGGLLLAGVAVLARRPDLLVIAAPLLGAALWGALLRPTVAPVVRQTIGHRVVREGGVTTWHVAVDDAEGRAEDVAAVLETPMWVDGRPIEGQVVVGLREDGDAGLQFELRPTRWGTRRLAPAIVVASSGWASFQWRAASEADAQLLVALPEPSAFDATSSPVRVPGLIGVNRSPRYDGGSEFARIRPFQPGDRLRRIQWPRSLRTGTLHVTSTWADHDRHVVLLVDAMDDIGDSEGVGGRGSSLDITMRAAAALAEHHVGRGDRVALVVLTGRGVQRVAPGAGHRHLMRLLETMAGVQPTTASHDDGRVPRGFGSGALVLMLSPLVSPAALQRAATIADRGITVVAIDCLPEDIVRRDRDDPYAAVAWRIELLKRAREIRRVGAVGVAVVPWRGPGSLDLVLRAIERHAGSRSRRR